MIEKITGYIKEQSCANICCIDENNKPYCFTCFYAYNSNEKLLICKSSADSHHSSILARNPAVAGTILPDKLNKLHIQGLQFEGTAVPAGSPLANNAAAFYYRKNPMAIAMAGEVWTIQVNSIKLTDSSLGFGKKLTWQREEQPVI